MRYSIVTVLACPACFGELTTIVVSEMPAPMPPRSTPASMHVAPEGALVAPRGSRPPPATALGDALTRYAAASSAPDRNWAVEVKEGVLACEACDRWFPVTGFLPELLPDHLRDPGRDRAFLDGCARVLPPDLLAALRDAPRGTRPASPVAEDAGAHYKRAEISIRERVDDDEFFSPGYVSPFNRNDTGFTVYLIKLFGAAVPLLDLKGGDTLIDSGCGYAWTTEWLFKAGVEAIGVDICRSYLEIGIERMGANRPHLVVGDVEHLPIRKAVVDAIFAYESFHHVPDRNRAMSSYGRILKHGGRAVLAEPGAAHEHAQIAVDVMSKYGILEKGMELADIERYISGTPMTRPEQVFVVRASDRELGATFDQTFARTHSTLEGNLFRVWKSDGAVAAVRAAVREPRQVIWPRVKRRLKTAMVRLGLE
jgi:SAM-dependent methyltransferase/uncharacterized protein YbaR (Trm112 family)